MSHRDDAMYGRTSPIRAIAAISRELPDRAETGMIGTLDLSFVLSSLLVFAVAFGTRLFFVVFAPFIAGDSTDYQRIALNMLSGNGYALHDAVPTTYRLPGYPIFIAAVYATTGAAPQGVLLMQASVGALAIWLLYLLGRLTIGERPSVVGSLLAGAYPHLAFYSATFLTETLTSCLLIAAILLVRLAIGARRFAPLTLGAGFMCALAALSSNFLAALPLVLATALLLARRSIRIGLACSLLLVAGYVIGLSPWVARNIAVFGTPVTFSTQGYGQGLWLAATQVELYDYSPFFDPRAREREPLLARWHEVYGAGALQERERVRDRLDLDAAFLQDAVSRILADPVAYLAHRARVLPALWVQPAAYAGHFRPPFTRQNPQLATMLRDGDLGAATLRLASIAVFTLGLYGGLAIGIWLGRAAWRERAFFYAPAVYVVIFLSPVWIEHRYSVITHPFLWLLAAPGLIWIARPAVLALTPLSRRLGATSPSKREAPPARGPRA